MFNSPILEVTIGMIFLYLLLSLICSALNELIEAGLQNRANDLEHGIRRLLDDRDPAVKSFMQHVWYRVVFIVSKIFGKEQVSAADPKSKTQGLASKLYAHGLIQCLYKDAAALPAYIPSRNFALALMDIVVPEGGGAAGSTRPSGPPPNTLIVNGNMPPPPPAVTLDRLRAAAANPANVPSERVRRTLLALIDAANDDAVRVRDNLENWYNSTTDRISGWYKRRTQIIILCIGIILSVALNADSVIVLNSLWENSALRSAVAEQAERYVVQENAAEKRPPRSGVDTVKRTKSQLAQLGLPIGWSAQDAAHTLPTSIFKDPKGTIKWSLYQLDLHWLGWFITGLAISLGAPFWFDLLNKFIVVRSTVKPAEKSSEESSKD